MTPTPSNAQPVARHVIDWTPDRDDPAVSIKIGGKDIVVALNSARAALSNIEKERDDG
jgi:hypothetical protein